MSKPTLKSLSALLAATVLFYWKILLTGQFSLLADREAVSQAYSWFHFWIRSIRHGSLPIWDQYSYAGHSFAGEMQTAAFYPLNFLLLLFPFNRLGVLSLATYHIWYAFAHFLGACFMYALVREFRLSRFAAVVAGICFSLGGFVAHAGWPHILHSGIWLPLILLFLVRGMRAETRRRVLVNASISGLCLGLAILAGGLHIVIMEMLVIASAAAFVAFQPECQRNGGGRRGWTVPAIAASVAAVVGLCAGAVQLLPSMEYSALALRWLGGSGAMPATAKIPYTFLTDSSNWPQSVLTLLFPGRRVGGGESIEFYLGVFPLLAAIAAVWTCWSKPWARYLTGLAAAAFAYSLGGFSLLHGALYALVPKLWMAREPDRFVFLIDFALAILAAFGVDALLDSERHYAKWSAMNRILAGVAIVCAAALAAPPLIGRDDLSPWTSLSILLIFASCGLFWHVTKGNAGVAVRLLIVGLVLFDLNAFEWTRSKIDVAKTGTNHLDLLLSCSRAARFLKSRPGLFRVAAPGDNGPNFGDVFEVRTIQGGGVTLLKDYLPLHSDHHDLLNVRYILKPASTADPGAIYQDAFWKVYEDSKAYPAAWVVHDTIIEPSQECLFRRLDDPAIDLHRTALLREPLKTALDAPPTSPTEEARFIAYEANRLELAVHAQSRGLLILSENFYPGWQATVNGEAVQIQKVDGGLRGIVVPPGVSRIVFRYVPWTVYAGGMLTLMAFAGALFVVVLDRSVRKAEPVEVPAAAAW